MLQFLESSDAQVAVPLTRDGEPFVADSGTIRWTLRDNTGQPMVGYVDQTVSSDTDTTIIVTVPAAANTVDPDKMFEKRTVVLTGEQDGVLFMRPVSYRVTPFLNHTVTPDDVRAFIGTDAGELPDAEIDITAAYFELTSRVTTALLTAALAAGDQTTILANRAIVAQTVLNCMPGLQARMSQVEQDGTLKVQRFDIDFAALTLQAMRILGQADLLIGGVVPGDAPVPTIFTKATPTIDPVTGEAPT